MAFKTLKPKKETKIAQIQLLGIAYDVADRTQNHDTVHFLMQDMTRKQDIYCAECDAKNATKVFKKIANNIHTYIPEDIDNCFIYNDVEKHTFGVASFGKSTEILSQINSKCKKLMSAVNERSCKENDNIMKISLAEGIETLEKLGVKKYIILQNQNQEDYSEIFDLMLKSLNGVEKNRDDQIVLPNDREIQSNSIPIDAIKEITLSSAPNEKFYTDVVYSGGNAHVSNEDYNAKYKTHCNPYSTYTEAIDFIRLIDKMDKKYPCTNATTVSVNAEIKKGSYLSVETHQEDIENIKPVAKALRDYNGVDFTHILTHIDTGLDCVDLDRMNRKENQKSTNSERTRKADALLEKIEDEDFSCAEDMDF